MSAALPAHYAAAQQLRRLIGNAEFEDHLAREGRRDVAELRARLAAERAAEVEKTSAALAAADPNYESPDWYRTCARACLGEAADRERIANEIDALIPRLGDLFLANADLVAATCDIAGFRWVKEPKTRLHSVHALTRSGHAELEGRAEVFLGALTLAVRATAEWHREEAAKARQEADDLFVEAESLEWNAA